MLKFLTLQGRKSQGILFSAHLTCRTLASNRRVKKRDNNIGIEDTTTTKTKDADDEFMKLWKSTENHTKELFHKTIAGNKRRAQKSPRIPRMATLPLQRELTEKETLELVEDSDKIGYRVPKFHDIIQNLGLTKPKMDSQTLMKELPKKVSQNISERNLNFQDMGVHPKLIAKLQKYGISSPVPIQQRALPLIFDNQSVLIKSETGSGKTLVFLIPTVQDPGRSFGTVIIVPTRELASQMFYEAHRLLGDKSIVASFVSGIDLESQEKRLQNTTNLPRIVIGTPKRFLEITEQREDLFQRTKRIIVDEVDKIFSPLHKKASRKKLFSRAVHPRPGLSLVEKIAKLSKVPNKQFVGASATVSTTLLEDLSDMGWGDYVTVVQSPSYEGRVRSIPSCIEHRYTVFNENLDLSKANVIARTFGNSNQKSALVFIHRNLSVDDFVWELRYLGLQAVALYKKIASQDPSCHESFLSDFNSGKFQLVVATEETVRGLDFQDLEHVYLTEVPKNVEEYMHLAGRVGRQGKQGTVTTIVCGDVSGEERRMLLQYRRLGISHKQV